MNILVLIYTLAEGGQIVDYLACKRIIGPAPLFCDTRNVCPTPFRFGVNADGVPFAVCTDEVITRRGFEFPWREGSQP